MVVNETKVRVGAEAPNFDLASTEDVVLMLRDEVARSPVLLCFFQEQPDDGSSLLQALANQADELQQRGVRILGVSPAKTDELKTVQAELKLPFPLLSDDREFARLYGFGEEGSCALVLVDQDQQVLWRGADLEGLESFLRQDGAALQRRSRPSAGYPRAVVNRWIARGVG